MKSVARENNRIVLELERGEAALLAALPVRLADRLRSPKPSRFAEDEKTNTELAHLLDAELAARRVERLAGFSAALAAVPDQGGRLELTLDQADQWLALLADLRLALAGILGIENDDWGRDQDPRHPPTQEHALYYYLTHLQGSLLEHGFGIT